MAKRSRKRAGKRVGEFPATLGEVSRPTLLAVLLSTLLGRPDPAPTSVPVLPGSRLTNGSWASRSAWPLLLSTLAAGHAYAQSASPDCSQTGTALTCTVAAGSYSAPLQQQAAQQGGSLDITNYGTFAITEPPGGYGLNFFTRGVNVGQGLTGGNAGQLTANNAGGLKLTNGAGSGVWTSALLMQSIGGNGGPATSSVVGGNGGNVPDQLVFTNSAPVTLYGYFPGGASGLEAQSTGGGSGIDNSDPGAGQAGKGGNGGDVQLTNSGAVTLGTSTTPASAYFGARGVAALSTGAGGGAGSASGGAAGGASGGVAVYNAASVSLVGQFAFANPFRGYFGVAALTTGGAGAGTVTKNTFGGAGGGAGSAFVSQGGDVLVVEQEGGLASSQLIGAGVAALATGGAGGSGYDHSPGGAGGAAGAATVTVTDASVTTEAPFWSALPAILAQSTGGSGGAGTVNQDTSSGGAGGASGAVAVTVGTTMPTQRVISTFGLYSPAIVAVSRGGAGGTGADYNPGFNISGSGGAGGAGGSGADVTVTLQNNTWAATYLDNSAGITAASYGGAGGAGGLYGGGLTGSGGSGGSGGDAGNVTVTLASGSLVSTAGVNAPGVEAYSFGGLGAAGGHSGDPFEATGGNGGNGGSGKAVSVTVASGARITTVGPSSAGIIAQSFGNTGGAGGSADSLDAPPGNPGQGGSTGTVTVQNAGKVETFGAGSTGILAQAISGAGGAGGTSTSVIYGAGTSGGAPGQLGEVSVANTGLVYTWNSYSTGILVQSISGGGGAGGGASGAIVSVGGNAGQGANGGSASATVGGVVATQGDGSVGVQVQSVGGGGGTAGQASTDGIGIGGSGSSGGDGGVVTATLSGTIVTAGALAHGVQAQSIGGGGGSAGSSDSFIAIGGSGAAVGNGGDVTIGSAGSVTTSGSQAIGVIAQSIGGGGGSGGNALQGIVSVGGSASGGGIGGGATINSSGAVTTRDDLAPGLLAMSIGGGGGVGGNATSYGAVVGVSVGGSGGAGGTGGAATVSASNGTDVKAYGTNAMGIAALSVGGGGGTGGSGYTITGSTGFGASVAVGGSGGAGGAGGAATVSLNQARITTGLGATEAVDPATIPDGNPIPALPVSGYGAVALSVGGGGGTGGSAMAKTYVLDFPTSPEPGSPSFALSGAFAVGGSGGVAGNGGGATVNVANGTGILTYGNDSHGVLASSIGGGGGQGGDASATATTFGFKNLSRIGVPPGGTKDPGDLKQRPNYNFDLDVSVGGTGGAGGDGGAVNVTIRGTDGVADPAQSPPVVIQTLGDYAYGVHAQSVGGGGGNAGTGAGSTQNGTAAGTALTAAINVGASGGGGGTGGPVQVTQFAGSLIATAGDTAYGILAHSAGGGGGTSTGGSYQFGFPGLSALQPLGLLPEAHRKSYYEGLLTIFGGIYSSMTIKVGTDGAGGGDGGNVGVSVGGAVRTTGEAATAAFAQSVGGGGGVAGSAGSTGSSDNPTVIDDLKTVKQFANDLLAYPLDVITSLGSNSGGNAALLNLKDLFPAFNLNLSFGGTGGSGGDGGNVQVGVNGGEIATAGDYAIGVQAQSVGGGGGAGGGAVAGGSSGFGNLMKINANFALGGSGGSGGTGGPVTVSLGGAKLETKGYAAYGVQAQSVGGGGGLIGSAQTSSTGIFSLGASTTGGAASGGDGGTVVLSQVSADVSAPAQSTLSTAGDTAHGVFLQSIGGGGGTAGEGFTGAAGFFSATTSGTHQFKVGGAGAYGNGGLVQLPSSAAPWVAITTTGASAYGILAQSVGGGGGLAFTNPEAQSTNVIGGATTASSSGGNVDINLRDGSSIVTSGNGSTAILAQSVGGGGGIAGYASGAPLLYQATAANGPGKVTNGSGGAITIDTGNATIQTTGGAAHGIFAQSVGGGGGLSAGGDGISVIAGTTGAAGSTGQGGTITISQTGTINATGENSVGIAAQSVGPSGGGVIAITVNGAVAGGSGTQGAGVWVMDGATTSTLTINSGGSLSALSGVAATYTGGSTFNVYNHGTMTGSVSVAKTTGNGSGTIYNYGTWNQPGAAGDVVNHGQLLVAGPRSIGHGTITGHLAQSGTGTIVVDADFKRREADLLTVQGDAQLAGTIKPVFSSIRPRVALPVLEVEGNVSGSLKVDSSSLFGFDLTRSGNQFLLSASSASFAPPAFGLKKALHAVAEHLDSIWNRGGANAYDTLFGLLGNTADASPSAYANQLRQLSPDATIAPGARGNARAQNFAAGSLSCPIFEGTTAMLVEGQCAWLRVTESRTDQSPGNGVSDFKIDATTTQIGAQFQVAPGWFVGGSAAYATDRLSSSDGLTSGDGQSGYGALTLKHQTGPWLFAASAFGGAGNVDTRRTINLPGFQAVATGNPDTSSYGLLLRAAYTIGREEFYLRPSLSLSATHVRTGTYQESGAGALDLAVDSASQTTWAATPMIEVGGRVPVGGEMILRPYVSAGVSFLSNDEWQQTARLVGAPAGTASFTTTVPIDPVVARISAGVQLYTGKAFDLRLQYDGEFSKTVTANGGSLIASYRF